MHIAQDDLREMWETYKRKRSVEVRNALIENYLPLVKAIAERLHARLPKEVETQDLVSEGLFGLVETIEAFDMERGVSFEAFSSQRIQGAMLDKLRVLDWVPRRVRSQHHRIENAYRQFEIQHGRLPTVEELAEQMQLTIEEFLDLARSASAVSITSLSRKYCETESERAVFQIDLLKDKRTSDPSEQAQRQDIRDLVTRGMNQKERLVTILYYYEEMTMSEIGAVLDLSESRVSQMHASILMRVQKLLRDRQVEFVV